MHARVVGILVGAVLCCSVVQGSETLTPPYSWRGINGQGVFPAGTVPTQFWDIQEGAEFKENMSHSRRKNRIRDLLPAEAVVGSQKNIIWRTLLPNWGQNTPVVMGDRVFLMTEGGWKSDTAEMVCLSALDGKILWQKPVDRMDAWPEAERTDGKRKRAMEIKRWQTYFKWWNRLAWDNDTSTPAELAEGPYEAIRQEAAEAGWEFPEHGKFKLHRICDVGNGAYRGRYGLREAPAEMRANSQLLAKERIHMREGWTSEGPWYGNTMGSVVGDGKVIYGITALGDAAAYDLDGDRLWAIDLGVPFVSSGPPTCHMQPNHVSWSSPTLALLSPDEDQGKTKGRVLVWFSNEAQSFYGIDVDQGQVVWTTPTPKPYDTNSYNPNGTPVLMRLTDTDGSPVTIAISSHGMAVRVRDGHHMGMVGGSIHEMDPDAQTPFPGSFLSWVAQGDLLVVTYSSKHGEKPLRGATAGVRLTLKGGELVEDWQWKGELVALKSNLIAYNGHIYSGDGGIGKRMGGFRGMDSQTGKLIAGVGAPGTGGDLCGAPFTGTQVIGKTGGGGHGDALWSSYAVSSYPDMKPQGYGLFIVPWPKGELAERHIATRGASVLRWGSGMQIAPWGNRIFIRSNDYIWCVGDPTEGWEPPETFLE